MLKPTNDWIVTKPIVEKEKKTEAGILLVSKLNDPTKRVEIISFGPEANKDGSLKVGDVVLVPTKTGIKVEHENDVFEMTKEKNFLGIID